MKLLPLLQMKNNLDSDYKSLEVLGTDNDFDAFGSNLSQVHNLIDIRIRACIPEFNELMEETLMEYKEQYKATIRGYHDDNRGSQLSNMEGLASDLEESFRELKTIMRNQINPIAQAMESGEKVLYDVDVYNNLEELGEELDRRSTDLTDYFEKVSEAINDFDNEVEEDI